MRSVLICYEQNKLRVTGVGVEYFHRSPASRRRRREGNPVPGGYEHGDLALQVGGVSNLRQQNVVMNHAGPGP
jgi:hypothetical protein